MLREGLITSEELAAMLEVAHVGSGGLVAARWAVPRIGRVSRGRLGQSRAPSTFRRRRGTASADAMMDIHESRGSSLPRPALQRSQDCCRVRRRSLTSQSETAVAVTPSAIAVDGAGSRSDSGHESRCLSGATPIVFDTIRRLLIERTFVAAAVDVGCGPLLTRAGSSTPRTALARRLLRHIRGALLDRYTFSALRSCFSAERACILRNRERSAVGR